MPLIHFQPLVQTTAQFVVFLLITLLIAGCSEPDYIPETFLDEPTWLASTKAPTVSTPAEVRKLWQSEKRCCENEDKLFKNAKIFYKACYMAIANDRKNEELVHLCLSLMDHKMPKKVVRTIHDHYLKNYFYYKPSTEHCVNCLPGDKVAIVSQDYARSISYAGNHRGAITAISRVLNERGDEISSYVQMDLYNTLAQFHEKSSITQSEFSAIQAAYTELELSAGSTRAGLHNFERLGNTIERLRKLVPNDL